MNWDVGSSDCGSLAQHCLCWPSHSLATVRSRDSLTPLLQSICLNCTGNTSGIAVRRRATALNAELVGIGPMCVGRHGFNERIFGADKQVSKGGCGRCPKN